MNLVQVSSPPRPSPTPVSAARLLRGPSLFGIVVILVFFGGFGFWAATAPLSSGAMASGAVSPDLNRRVIQHLEGGIIKQVLVTEGQTVASGDLLVTLEPTLAAATVASLRGQYLRLVVIRARTDAQALERDSVTLPDEVTADPDPALQAFAHDQIRLFEIRRTSLDQQQDIFERQIAQLNSEIQSVEATIKGLNEQHAFIQSEIDDKEGLLEQQLISRSAILALQRERARLESDIASNEAVIARGGQKIEEINLSILQSRESFRNEVTELATSTNNEIAQLQESMIARGDILTRTEIRSPVAGIVLNIRQQTGVVAPGSPIMDVVPVDENLLILARLSPQDVEVVTVGMKARVTLIPFANRNALPLDGEVIQVSADTVADERSGMAYYEVRVRIAADELARHKGIYLSPGMPADVMIVAGERTMLQYLAEPLIRSIQYAFVHD